MNAKTATTYLIKRLTACFLLLATLAAQGQELSIPEYSDKPAWDTIPVKYATGKPFIARTGLLPKGMFNTGNVQHVKDSIDRVRDIVPIWDIVTRNDGTHVTILRVIVNYLAPAGDNGQRLDIIFFKDSTGLINGFGRDTLGLGRDWWESNINLVVQYDSIRAARRLENAALIRHYGLDSVKLASLLPERYKQYRQRIIIDNDLRNDTTAMLKIEAIKKARAKEDSLFRRSLGLSPASAQVFQTQLDTLLYYRLQVDADMSFAIGLDAVKYNDTVNYPTVIYVLDRIEAELRQKTTAMRKKLAVQEQKELAQSMASFNKIFAASSRKVAKENGFPATDAGVKAYHQFALKQHQIEEKQGIAESLPLMLPKFAPSVEDSLLRERNKLTNAYKAAGMDSITIASMHSVQAEPMRIKMLKRYGPVNRQELDNVRRSYDSLNVVRKKWGLRPLKKPY